MRRQCSKHRAGPHPPPKKIRWDWSFCLTAYQLRISTKNCALPHNRACSQALDWRPPYITVEKSVDNQSVKFSSASFLHLTKLYSLSPNLHYLDRSCLELTKVGKMPHSDISQKYLRRWALHIFNEFFFGPKALLMNLLNLLSQVFQRHNAMVPYVEGLTEEEANSIGDSLRDLIQTRIHGLQRPTNGYKGLKRPTKAYKWLKWLQRPTKTHK